MSSDQVITSGQTLVVSRNLFTNLQRIVRPPLKKFFVQPIKLAIFRVDMRLNGEYNEENLLEALKKRR